MAKTLQPWPHVQPLEDFRREIDELFSRFVGGRGRTAGPIPALPPIESFLDGSEYVIRLDLPGIEPKDIEVTVTEDVVIVRASIRAADNSSLSVRPKTLSLICKAILPQLTTLELLAVK
jgi:HSP20 family protein